MPKDLNQIEMFPDFKVKDASFVHFFKHVMESGKLANLSGNAIKAYLVIKLHSSFTTGEAIVPLTKLLDKTGIKSKPTLIKALRELESNFLLTTEKEIGKENKYTILEEFEASPETRDPVANITIPYVRGSINKQIKNLPAEIISAWKKEPSNGNLTINFNFADNRTQIFNSEKDVTDTIEAEIDIPESDWFDFMKNNKNN